MELNPFQPAEPASAPSMDDISPPPHQAGQVFGPSLAADGPSVTPAVPEAPQAAVTTPAAAPVQPASPFDSPERPLGVAQAAQPASEIQSFSSATTKSRRRLPRKRAIIIAAAAFILLGGGAAAYFGYYAPNQPDNLWGTALGRTGKGYDKLSDYLAKTTSANYKGTSTKGSFKLSGELAADGTFQGSSDGDNSEFTSGLSAGGVKVDLDLRTIKSATSTPDIYFKVDGLQGLGDLLGGADSPYGSLLNGFSGNWYFIDHSLFDQFTQGGASNLQITSADVKSLLTGIGGPSKTYVFNGDAKKSIFTVKQNVGKEKQDGRNTYHYKVGLNKTNLMAYNNALCDSLKGNKIFKLLGNGDSAAALKECKDTSDIDNIKDSQTADVWVDTHTKLIHKARFTDSSNSNSYVDIGQDYQGGDQIPFFIDAYSKDSGTTDKLHIGVTLDMKANTLAVKGTFNTTGSDSSSNESATFDMTISPNNKPLKVDKPASSKTLIELLNDLGIGDLFSDLSTGTSANAKDTERKTDINALHGQIEAFNATNGYYPTLADINNATWRSTNMKGLDAEALKDPDSTAAALAAAPAAHVYSYQATPAGCSDTKVKCEDYTLTATLDGGGTYVKQALNGSDTTSPGGGATIIQN